MGIPLQDEASQQKAVQAVTVAAGAAYGGTALNGTTVDRIPGAGQRYLSAKFVLESGNGAANDVVQAKLFESDDDSTFTEVTSVTVPALNDAADFETVDVDLSGLKRYVRLQFASADQTVGTSIDVAAHCVLSGASEQPVSDG